MGAKIISGNDYPLECWGWISLKGEGYNIITLINASCVNPGHSNIVKCTNKKQQVFIKLKEVDDTYNNKNQIIIYLKEFIQNRLDQEEYMIICIDANKTMNKKEGNNETMHTMMQLL